MGGTDTMIVTLRPIKIAVVRKADKGIYGANMLNFDT
jgi:hypothetical protein